jgi:hypothetical protein
MDKKRKEKRDTPIIDGDARPDMPLNVEDRKKKSTDQRGKFESERISDTNSLEDYKDAK